MSDGYEVGKLVIEPLTLGRARITLPDTQWTYSKAW